MSADSSFAMLAALRDRLIADAPLSGIIAGRVYVQAPSDVAYPWVQSGDVQSMPFEDGGCIVGSELFITLHSWSRAQTASAEVLRINAAIRDSLHAKTFPMIGHRLQLIEFTSGRMMRDPDGITWHGVIDFHAFTTASA